MLPLAPASSIGVLIDGPRRLEAQVILFQVAAVMFGSVGGVLVQHIHFVPTHSMYTSDTRPPPSRDHKLIHVSGNWKGHWKGHIILINTLLLDILIITQDSLQTDTISAEAANEVCQVAVYTVFLLSYIKQCMRQKYTLLRR